MIAPVRERILSIDLLRGIALFGILLVNILGFNASFFAFGDFYSSLPDADQLSFFNVFISLTADKFIFLFSFLFGYGIFMQISRFQKNNLPFAGFFLRRMAVLFVFGVFHVLILWAGDVLILYALAGIFILIIIKLPLWLKIFTGLLAYFFVGFWLLFVSGIDPLSSTCPECLALAKTIYPSGNYPECFHLRMLEYISFRNINLIYYLPKIAGITLFGYVASSFRLHNKVSARPKTWFIVWVLISGISVLLYLYFDSFISFEKPYAMAAYMAAYELMNLFLACSYLLLILLAAQLKIISKILRPFEIAGKMSLSNYLLQSVIMAVLFYGWGFGMFGQTNIKYLILLAVIIFAFQLILSVLWFSIFRQGPLEKLWRRITYSGIKNSKPESM